VWPLCVFLKKTGALRNLKTVSLSKNIRWIKYKTKKVATITSPEILREELWNVA
jgi:hypothetical protein